MVWPFSKKKSLELSLGEPIFPTTITDEELGEKGFHKCGKENCYFKYIQIWKTETTGKVRVDVYRRTMEGIVKTNEGREPYALTRITGTYKTQSDLIREGNLQYA